jgi:hypothetical protein
VDFLIIDGSCLYPLGADGFGEPILGDPPIVAAAKYRNQHTWHPRRVDIRMRPSEPEFITPCRYMYLCTYINPMFLGLTSFHSPPPPPPPPPQCTYLLVARAWNISRISILSRHVRTWRLKCLNLWKRGCIHDNLSSSQRQPRVK